MTSAICEKRVGQNVQIYTENINYISENYSRDISLNISNDKVAIPAHTSATFSSRFPPKILLTI